MSSKPLKTRSDLLLLVKQSIAQFNALTPEQQREHRAIQRRSWCIGETMLAHPELTLEDAKELYEKACL